MLLHGNHGANQSRPKSGRLAIREAAALGRLTVEQLQIQKVLQIWQGGHEHPPRLARIRRTLNWGFLAGKEGPGRALPLKGDVMILRLNLVAGPGGSDWRTRRPSRLSITP